MAKINIDNYIKKEYGTTTEVLPTNKFDIDKAFSPDLSKVKVNTDLDDYNQLPMNRMKSILSINSDSADWSKLYIMGQTVPGIAKVSVSFTKEIKKEKKPGYDYTKVKDYGANSKEISVSILMNGFDYTIYKRDIQPLLEVKSFASKEENILLLENTLLSDYGIDYVLLEQISQSTPEVGVTIIDLSFIEAHDIIKQAWTKDIKNIKTTKNEQGDITGSPLTDGTGKF